MSKYLFLYHKSLIDTKNLINGRLLLIDTETSKIIEKYIATSGSANWQEFDETWIRARGALPEQEDAGLDHYVVKTDPIFMPNVKGVEGNFYPILPFSIENKTGKLRGDFGIHYDANVPGSAGCIVIINKPAWDKFQETIAEIRTKYGIEEIPLIISYVK